ncbi:GNAT family N-acetyltransferase [Alphaproteobacteria bacterium]|nr:GNAT family N-acetyltransferase [Alphaproteobacteria bacterium]
MKLINNDIKNVTIRRVETEEELRAAQRLRYQVFFEEFGAKPSEEMAAQKLDLDKYDSSADHLIVISTDPASSEETIIGTYRMIKQDQAAAQGKFNSDSWYDLSPLLSSGETLLELSRSCVLPEYRTRPVLQLLWGGIADYITEHNIGVMFGCASFHTVNIEEIAEPLSYLYHHHLSPSGLRVRARDDLFMDMNILPKSEINPRKVFHNLPPLMKGYLRVGSTIGDGAVIDEQFGTVDVFITMQTHMLTQRYRKHYERKVDKEIPGGSSSAHKAADILAEDI